MLKKLIFTPLVVVGTSLPVAAVEVDSVAEKSSQVRPVMDDQSLVQIAILLDTSGSMKGLVDQARCQLWNVVSELARASRGDRPSRLQIAVYQYGTDKVSKKRGCIKQVTGFTEDLDEVSRAIFSLAIGGGDEFCGQVIDDALTNLEWNPDSNVYKAVFVAGNESFDQGNVPFGKGLTKALTNSILINSIYCFDPNYKEAVQGMDQWESAARLAEGMYFQINHNHHMPDLMTPYDKEMRELNDQMNETFVWYGKNAKKASKNQQMQDRNAADLSDHAFASRMSAKIGHLYHHVHDDLVDAVSHGAVNLDRMPEDKMPEELKVMSPDDRRNYIREKIEQRNRVRRQMAEVISTRHAHLQRMMSEQIGEEGKAPQVLGDALIEAVRKQATRRGFQFDKMSPTFASQNP